METLKIPFNGIGRQYDVLRDEILDATDRVLRSGQLMNGNNTVEFENWLRQRNNSVYAITLHSGTSALEIQARYYKHQLRDSYTVPRVLLPTFTFPATANAFINAGWEPVFVDCDVNGMMKVEDHDVDMVVLVGLYGASVESLFEQYYQFGFHRGSQNLIEDGAQHWLSNGAMRLGGSCAISFDPTKNLGNYGNGGALVTQDADLAEFARSWRNHGKGSDGTGSNLRMSEVDCAQMRVKTQYIDQWQSRRRNIVEHWNERFADEPRIRPLINSSNFANHSFHKYVIEVDNQQETVNRLHWRGIESRVHYSKPLHEQVAYSDYRGPGFMSVASSLSRQIVSLPIYPELTDLEVEYIADNVLQCVAD